MIRRKIEDCLILENPAHKGTVIEISLSGYLTIDNLSSSGTQSCQVPQWVTDILGQEEVETDINSFEPMEFLCLCDEDNCQNMLTIYDDGRLVISSDSGLPQTFRHHKEIVSKIASLRLLIELQDLPVQSPVPILFF